MGCCRKFFLQRNNRNMAVICLKWVLPLRLMVLSTILASAFYAVSHIHQLSGLVVFLLLIQLILSYTILNECRRSIDYHKRSSNQTNPDL